jgi:hypothetical protein
MKDSSLNTDHSLSLDAFFTFAIAASTALEDWGLDHRSGHPRYAAIGSR